MPCQEEQIRYTKTLEMISFQGFFAVKVKIRSLNVKLKLN